MSVCGKLFLGQMKNQLFKLKKAAFYNLKI